MRGFNKKGILKMKTIVAAVVAMWLFQGVSYGKEVLVLPNLSNSIDLLNYQENYPSGEFCLHGVSYLIMFGRKSVANATLERDRNGKPIPCVTQKTQNNNESK